MTHIISKGFSEMSALLGIAAALYSAGCVIAILDSIYLKIAKCENKHSIWRYWFENGFTGKVMGVVFLVGLVCLIEMIKSGTLF